MRRRLIIAASLLFLLTLAVVGGLVLYVKSATFPFVELKVVRTLQEFNAPPGDAPVSYDVPILPGLEGEPPHVPLETRLAEFVRHRLQDGKSTVLKSPAEANELHPAPAMCSEYAKLAVSACAAMKVPARVVWLQGHTVSEIWRADLEKWILVDTNGSQLYRSKGSHVPLGVGQLVSGLPAEPVVLKGRCMQCRRLPGDDPIFDEKSLLLYRGSNMCVVLEGPRLYDFHLRNRHFGLILGYIFGGQPVARGFQYVPQGKAPVAGSVIGSIRLVLVALLLFWIVGLVLAVFGTRKRERRIVKPASEPVA